MKTYTAFHKGKTQRRNQLNPPTVFPDCKLWFFLAIAHKAARLCGRNQEYGYSEFDSYVSFLWTNKCKIEKD